MSLKNFKLFFILMNKKSLLRYWLGLSAEKYTLHAVADYCI
jgi:hypothetical protein